MDENQALPDLAGLWRKISKEARLAFLSGMDIGFIVHLFVFSNLLINHDGAVSLSTGNDHITSGRWSLGFFSQFSGVYEMPVVIALLTVFALACTAGLTVAVLGLRSRVCIVLTSGFLVAFPSVCCVFPYLYTADAYFFALLLNALAVYTGKRWRFGWVVSAALIAAGAGIYQSFVCFAVGLFLMDCILLLLEGEELRPVLFRGGKYIAAIGGGLVLYRVLLQVLLAVNNTQLSNYRNMSEAVNSGVMDYLRTLPDTYRSFLRFFWSGSYLTAEMRLVQRVLLIFAAACGVFLLIRRKIYRQQGRLALVLVGAGLVPAALNLICVIAAGQTKINLLMQYAFVLVFVFILRVIEMTALELAAMWPQAQPVPHKGKKKQDRTGTPRPKQGFASLRKLPVAAGLVLCFVLLWNDFCLTNASYLRLDMVYENSFALANRIMARVEEMDEYGPDTPVVLAGTALGSYGGWVSFPELEDFPGQRTTLVNEYCGTPFVRSFIGSLKRNASEEQRREIMESGVLDRMPVYPAKDSIQVYNGIILVKLSDNCDLLTYGG